MIKMETDEPIKRRSNTELLNMYVSENNEVLQTDGNKLFCKICEKSISFETKFLVHRHLKSKKHQKISPLKSSATESKSLEIILSSGELSIPNKYVSEKTAVFETDKEKIFSKVRKKSIVVNNKLSVNKYLETQKHKTNYAQSVGGPSLDYANKYLPEKTENLCILEKSQDFCKTCMKHFSKTDQKDDKQNITVKPTGYPYSKSIMELLISIQPQIKVDIKDNFPTFMCSYCIQKLIVSYEFIEMYKTSDEKLRKIYDNFNEHEEQMDEIEVHKYEIEQIDIDSSESVRHEIVNKRPETEDVPIQVLSENEYTIFTNHNDGDSNDEWAPKRSCLNISHKKYNSDHDDVTKKVFKGFYQPEENEDGSITCQLCESVLDGVLPWREHIRQSHLEEKPKRAYNRRTNEPRKGMPKISRKILPNEKGLFQCEYCEKSYPKYLFFRRHLRIHAERTHLCIECGKSYSNITSYNSHILRHKGEKTFECSQCPKSFVCPSDLYGHTMTHTNNKPYVCDICGSAFRMPYQLRNHNRVHTGIKNYKCEYCDMKFKSRPNQICHMRTHTGEKPFRCKYCEKAFAQSGDCVKHMRQHFGDNNVYQCDLCPLRFPLVRDLRVHFATHKDDDEETRDRNLQARMEEEQNRKIELGSKKSI